MFKSIVDKIRKKQNVSVTALPNEDITTNSPEREEDGFVLLGETQSERNTVLPNSSGQYIDSPPSYYASILNNNSSTWAQNMGQQPSNQNIVKQTGELESANCQVSNTRTASSGSVNNNIPPSTPNRKQSFTEISFRQPQTSNRPDTIETQEPWDNSNSYPTSQKSPVSDVPFQLGELQRLTHKLGQENSRDRNSRIPHIDMNSYYYDFNLERSVIRDFDSNLKGGGCNNNGYAQ